MARKDPILECVKITVHFIIHAKMMLAVHLVVDALNAAVLVDALNAAVLVLLLHGVGCPACFCLCACCNKKCYQWNP